MKLPKFLRSSEVPLDAVISKLAGLGVPGLVLVLVMASTGFAGAAAITTALAALGGPLGMLGGIATLGVLLMLSHALTEYGFDKVFTGVVEKLHKDGVSNEEILKKIGNYPLGATLKRKLRELLAQMAKA